MIKVITYINFVLTLLIVGFLVWFVAFQNKTSEVTSEATQIVKEGSVQYIDQCGENCEKIIEDTVSKSLSTISAALKEKTTKTSGSTSAPTSTRNQTTYIPVVGPVSKVTSEWYDVPGTDFYLNIADYGKNSYATWEATLSGNGTAIARLYDATHNIGVNGSEVSVTNKGSLTVVYSGSLNFWAGNNLYRVQIKSLNGLEVAFGNGRLKIMY